jgi:tripartite ATP-independent transporter DctM subunit
MSELIIYVPALLYLALLAIGVPIGYSFLITGVIGLLLVTSPSATITLLSSAIYSNVSNYLLSTVPMFILMAYYLKESDIIEQVFTMFHYWLNEIKGGLAMATTVTNGGMAVLSGSSTATAATMANIAIPEMRKYGYHDKLSAGTVSAAGTFATMFPPSIPLIIYGIITGSSIKDLFTAGLIPGVITLLGYAALIYLWGTRDPEMIGTETQTYTWRERFASIKPVWPAGIVVVATLGSLYLGIVTPTEAGAIGAFGALLVGTIFSSLRLAGITTAHFDTVKTTTVIFIILMGADVFGRYLTITGITQQLLEWVTGLPLSPLVIMVAILAVYIGLGSLMDQLAILVMTLPITYPMALELGYGPIWFGIVIVKTIEIGLVTPPLGMNVIVATSVIDVDTTTAFRGSVRFLVVDFLVLLLLLLYPDVTRLLIA